jgi:hypothetical protein
MTYPFSTLCLQQTYVIEFEIRLGFFDKQCIVGLSFYNHGTNLYLLLDLFRSFTFDIVIDMLRLKSTTFFHFLCVLFLLRFGRLPKHFLEFYFYLSVLFFDSITLYNF